MINKVKVCLLFFALMVLAVNMVVIGCSKPEAPTQADFAKAIIEHALQTNCSIIPNTITIVEKGSRKQDGSWPYKVRYACMDQSAMKAHKRIARTEREVTVDLYKTVDSTGKPRWAAR